MCANVRSGLNKLDDIYATISSRKVNIFAATETWFHADISDDLIKIPSFNNFRCDRQLRRGGGVCIWSHSSLEVKLLIPKDRPNFLDAVWLSFPSIKVIFACLYIPPEYATTHEHVINEYIIRNTDIFLSYLTESDIIICGDLNRYNIQTICNQLDLDSLVQEPTRNAALLDYILISKIISSDFSVTVGPPISTSDHNSISAFPKVTMHSQNSMQRVIYDLRQSNLNTFIDTLSTIDWTSFYTSDADIDAKCDFLHDTLSEIVRCCIPMKTVIMHELDKPWMTPLLKNAIQARWDAYRRKDFPMYQHWKQKVKQLIVKAKQRWSSKAKNSSKDLWNIVKSETGTKNKNSLYGLINSCGSISSAVNTINDQFSSVFVADTINPDFTTENSSRRWTVHITITSVERKLSAINAGKAMGSDGIPSILYKLGAKYLAGPFAHLFNLSVEKRRFPRRWKHSHVCPIPKTTPADIENLRPISLLPVPAKILEQFILSSVRSLFIENFGKNQFGCRPSSSTSCAVITLRHHALRALESLNVSGMKIITYDFTKAFDKLSHNLICNKLASSGFPTPFIRWTQSYLRDRTQATRIGSTTSFSTKVVSGVPQGSVLGPMFFCLVVGNLTPLHAQTQIIQYVDDTTLCIPLFKNDGNSHVIKEHRRILDWASENGFIVNSKKCQSLFVAKSRNARDVQLKDVPVVNEIKFLGLILNNHLTWNSHVHHICRLASRRFYALRILKNVLPTDQLVAVYYGVIRSILEYASPVFGKLPRYLDEEMNKLQKRCHRFICGVSRSSQCHCNRFPSLSERRNLAACKLFLSATETNEHVLHQILPTKSHRSLRIILPTISTCRFSHSFVPYTATLINGITDCLT